MITVNLAKKSLVCIIAACVLLFTFIFVVNNMELPIWRQLRNLTNEEHYSNALQRSNNTTNTVSSTLTILSSSEKVPAQKPGLPDKTEKLNDKQLSTSQQPERSTVLNGSHLLHNDSRFETNVSLLADILQKKLSAANINVINFRPTCENAFKLANSCDNNKCLQTDLPRNVTARVEQLVTPRKLQMSPEEHEILHQMANNVTGNYDIILLTAASSNHFLESQAMLKNLHENVYPHLKNFTLVYYNLGLTEQERTSLVKYCKCQVMDFPFHKFPPFMKTLKCYAWKPIVIKAHLQKTNVVFWMDVSIRFHNTSTHLHNRIQTARERGFHVGGPNGPSAFRNHRGMHHFFGDEPCAYLNLQQAAATFGVYHREYFVDRVVLEPWVACALNENCMCLEPTTSINCAESFKMANSYGQGKGPIVYGLCHRFDQSAISIILHKLYQDLYLWVMVGEGPVLSIQRDHLYAYFESLKKSETVKP